MNQNDPEDQTRSPVDLSTSKVISDTFFVSASKIGVTLLKPIRSVILEPDPRTFPLRAP